MTSAETPLRHLVVPLDGSSRASRALDVAAAVAEPTGADITVLGVVKAPEASEVFAGDLTAAVAASTVGTERGAEVDVVVDEDCAGAILEAAASRDATLVLATDGHGHGSHALLGSVATAVLRRSGRPVLLVGPKASAAVAPRRVVACLDGSPLAERTLPAARDLAARLGVPLFLLQVLEVDAGAGLDVPETAYLDHMSNDLGGDVGYEVVHGDDAAEAIGAWVDHDPGTVLVACTHGRSGLSQLVLGSVVAGLVRSAEAPVLVVPATEG